MAGALMLAPDDRIPGADVVPPPPRRAVWAAYWAAAAPTVGFIPLHLVWALGIPLFADADLFDPWYTDGGGTYLWTLNALALLPAVLALALVRPWGLVIPRSVPVFGGHRVPRLLLIVPGTLLSTGLFAYTAMAPIVAARTWDHPGAIFSPWTVVFGIVVFAVWICGLAIATHSYARRTRPPAS
ncbi:MAG TPA: hypothetical protein VES42_00410 [Pilimelia sp.]|nr:hypothetical protein [Pilimelia sp.]